MPGGGILLKNNRINRGKKGGALPEQGLIQCRARTPNFRKGKGNIPFKVENRRNLSLCSLDNQNSAEARVKNSRERNFQAQRGGGGRGVRKSVITSSYVTRRKTTSQKRPRQKRIHLERKQVNQYEKCKSILSDSAKPGGEKGRHDPLFRARKTHARKEEVNPKPGKAFKDRSRGPRRLSAQGRGHEEEKWKAKKAYWGIFCQTLTNYLAQGTCLSVRRVPKVPQKDLKEIPKEISTNGVGRTLQLPWARGRSGRQLSINYRCVGRQFNQRNSP